ncbi:MAG: apolipoprotein N-acyltransferase [Nitrospirae bacterium]|nr:apolipoprotein N-acyltransferase [Nitrospirota bacterium]
MSFPMGNHTYFAWFAMVPLLLRTVNGQKPFKKGFITGLVFFFGTQSWINNSISRYGHVPFFLGVLIVLALCAYEGLYAGLFGYLVNRVSAKTKIPIFLSVPSLWVGLEYLRGILLTGFPWSFLGYTQYRALPLIQVSNITGVYGVSFILVMSNAVIAALLLNNPFVKQPSYKPSATDTSGKITSGMLTSGTFECAIFGAAAFAVVLAASLIYGYAVIKAGTSDVGRTDAVTISVIQGNIAQGMKWDKKYEEEVIGTYENLSRRALEGKSTTLQAPLQTPPQAPLQAPQAPRQAPAQASPQPPQMPQIPQMIVWPETSLPFLFYYDMKNTKSFIEFDKTMHTYLLFGTVIVKGFVSNQYKISNSAVLLNPDGQIEYVYDKVHLVPFGEYVPFKNVLNFVGKLVNAVGDFDQGKEKRLAKTSIGSFAVHICYEIVFPGLVREFYENGGDFIVTITNDAWFGKSAGPYQHFIMSIFRAVENGKPLVRAANTGISGFVDATGAVLGQTGLFEKTVLTVKIYKNSRLTFYSAYGDLFAFGCNLFNLFMVIRLIAVKLMVVKLKSRQSNGDGTTYPPKTVGKIRKNKGGNRK